MMWKATFIYGSQAYRARRCVAWVAGKSAKEVRDKIEKIYNIAYYEEILRYPKVTVIPESDVPWRS